MYDAECLYWDQAWGIVKQHKQTNPFLSKWTFSTSEKPGTSSASISNAAGEKAKQLPSFWLPSLTPQAKKALVKKPVSLMDVGNTWDSMGLY